MSRNQVRKSFVILILMMDLLFVLLCCERLLFQILNCVQILLVLLNLLHEQHQTIVQVEVHLLGLMMAERCV